MSVTIANSSPHKRLRSEDFPTLGFPTIAVSIPCDNTEPSLKVETRILRLSIIPVTLAQRISL